MATPDELNLWRQAFGGRTAAIQMYNQGAQEADPDEAAKALRLGRETGLQPQFIYGDDGAFERTYKTVLDNDIIANDARVQRYLGANPMHAKISNDDIGGLAQVSQHYDRYLASTERPWYSLLARGVARGMGEGGSSALDALGYLSGSAEMRAIANRLQQATTDLVPMSDAEQRSISARIGGLVGGLLDIAPAALLPEVAALGTAGAFMGLVSGSEQLKAAEAAGKPGGAPFAAGAATGAILGVLPLGAIGRTAGLAKKAGIGAVTMTAVGEGQEAINQAIAKEFYNPAATYQPDLERAIASGLVGGLLGGAHAAFFRAGEKPPPGADKTTDKAYTEDAKQSAEDYKTLVTEIRARPTYQRSPEAMASLLEGDKTHALSADGLRLVYPEGEFPRPGDGKLGDIEEVVQGFVPGTVSSIEIPLNKWVTRVPETLQDELADHLIHSRDGISVDQVEKLKEAEPPKAEEAEAAKPVQTLAEAVLDIVKRAAGLDEKTVTGIDDIIRETLPKDAREDYDEKIAKQDAEDEAWLRRQQERIARARQTKEWKEEALKIRKEVKEQIDDRSDVALDNYLRQGVIREGTIRRIRYKINTDDLTGEQMKGIPEEFLSKELGKGVKPEDLANAFGYPSAEAMLNDLRHMEEIRRRHGIGPDEWRSRTIEAEVEARMEEKFGPLEGNIVREMESFVYSPTILERLHAQVLNLGKSLGVDLEDYPTFKRGIQVAFDKMPVRTISSKRLMLGAQFAARGLERELLAGNAAGALEARMRNMAALHLANLAKKYESMREVFDAAAKKNSNRERAGIGHDYMAFIHQIMTKVGLFVDRSPEDLQKQFDSMVSGPDLEAFYKDKIATEQPHLYVADFLRDPQFLANVDHLTFEEFEAVHNTFKSMEHAARDENNIIVKGEKRDRRRVEQAFINLLETFGRRDQPYNKTLFGKTIDTLESGLAQLMQFEAWLSRLDRGDTRNGVFTNTFGKPSAAAAAYERRLGREVGEQLAKLPKFSMKDRVSIPMVLGVNRTTPLDMNVGNLVRIIINMGTHSNWEKLYRGEALWAGITDREAQDAYGRALEAEVFRVAKPEHFEFADGLHKILRRIKDLDDQMVRSQNGLPVEELQNRQIRAPHKTYDGGYAHVWSDPLRRAPNTIEAQQEELPYIRASVPRKFTRERTGAIYPVDLNINNFTNQIPQMLHRVAWDPFIKEAGKALRSNNFQNAVIRTWGERWNNMSKQWLDDMANQKNHDTLNGALTSKVIETLRTNLVSSLIGVNPGTVMKHFSTAMINSITEVGPHRMVQAMSQMFSGGLRRGASVNRFIDESSEFMRSRHPLYAETFGGGVASALGKPTWRQQMAYFGSWMVATSDAASARPLWLAAYDRELRRLAAEGKDITDDKLHGVAVDQADLVVRQAHGSMLPSSRPELMRRGGLSQWFTSLYGFFSHIFQRQYELAWRSADAAKKAYAGDLKEAAKDVPRISMLLFSYVLAPAIVEELVTPLTNQERESWGAWSAKVVGGGLASSVPVVRDVAHALLGGHDPSLGLMGTEIHNILQAPRDLNKRDPLSHRNMGKLVEDTAALAGVVTGFPMQLGRSARFLINYNQDLEHPHGLVQTPWSHDRRRSLLGGLWHGTAEVKHRP